MPGIETHRAGSLRHPHTQNVHTQNVYTKVLTLFKIRKSADEHRKLTSEEIRQSSDQSTVSIWGENTNWLMVHEA
jgi:hypothetical protein